MNVSLYLMSVLYVAAGVNHFINPGMYLRIMPHYVPYHIQVVQISGVLEIVFALMLLPLLTRKIAAWLIILLLIAVFPANIQMAINYYQTNNPMLWLAIIRLPLQVFLVWWAWLCTK